MNKPRLVQITSVAEHMALEAGRIAGDLDFPIVYREGEGMFVDATELRLWRASQNTSTVKHD